MSESNNIYLKIQIHPKISLEFKNFKKDNNRNIKYLKIPDILTKENDKNKNIFDKLKYFDFFQL